MMTVRYPNGQAIQYNNAGHITHGSGDWILREREGGPIVAIIQQTAGVIVEFKPPCLVYDGMRKGALQQLESQVATLTKEIRSLKRKLNRS